MKKMSYGHVGNAYLLTFERLKIKMQYTKDKLQVVLALFVAIKM